MQSVYFTSNFLNFTCITVLCVNGVLTSVLLELKGLTIYAFVLLLLAMISLHMLTFRLMVTIVAELRYFIFLIHNTLLGENDQQYKNYKG